MNKQRVIKVLTDGRVVLSSGNIARVSGNTAVKPGEWVVEDNGVIFAHKWQDVKASAGGVPGVSSPAISGLVIAVRGYIIGKKFYVLDLDNEKVYKLSTTGIAQNPSVKLNIGTLIDDEEELSIPLIGCGHMAKWNFEEGKRRFILGHIWPMRMTFWIEYMGFYGINFHTVGGAFTNHGACVKPALLRYTRESVMYGSGTITQFCGGTQLFYLDTIYMKTFNRILREKKIMPVFPDTPGMTRPKTVNSFCNVSTFAVTSKQYVERFHYVIVWGWEPTQCIYYPDRLELYDFEGGETLVWSKDWTITNSGTRILFDLNLDGSYNYINFVSSDWATGIIQIQLIYRGYTILSEGYAYFGDWSWIPGRIYTPLGWTQTTVKRAMVYGKAVLVSHTRWGYPDATYSFVSRYYLYIGYSLLGAITIDLGYEVKGVERKRYIQDIGRWVCDLDGQEVDNVCLSFSTDEKYLLLSFTVWKLHIFHPGDNMSPQFSRTKEKTVFQLYSAIDGSLLWDDIQLKGITDVSPSKTEAVVSGILN